MAQGGAPKVSHHAIPAIRMPGKAYVLLQRMAYFGSIEVVPFV